MPYKVQRSETEVDEQINQASDAVNDGASKFPGMSYEAGVQAALQWIIGEEESAPMAE